MDSASPEETDEGVKSPAPEADAGEVPKDTADQDLTLSPADVHGSNATENAKKSEGRASKISSSKDGSKTLKRDASKNSNKSRVSKNDKSKKGSKKKTDKLGKSLALPRR